MIKLIAVIKQVKIKNPNLNLCKKIYNDELNLVYYLLTSIQRTVGSIQNM